MIVSRNNILVVGGYGQVGRVISTWLGQRYPGHVIAAGRHIEKINSHAVGTNEQVRPLVLDLDSNDEYDALLGEVRVAVSSVERPDDDHFVRACLARGVHYIEVGTSFETLQRVLRLNSLARESGAAAVACAGLTPGLSNLIAAYLAGKLDHTQSIDIHLMLGLGDSHGVDAVRWMLSYADRCFTIQTAGGPKTVESLTDPVKVTFPGETKQRTTYRFDLADQHVLPTTTGTAGASTRLCFDVRWVTLLVAGMKRANLVRALQRWDPSTLVGLLRMLKLGSDLFALQVEAAGVVNDRVVALSAGATGREEARATGVVTALAADALYQGWIPPGVHHLEQVLQIADLLGRLEKEGIHLWLP